MRIISLKVDNVQEFKFYWFCPQCQGILQQKKGAPGGGKFVLNSKNIDIGIESATRGKKLAQSGSEDAKQVAYQYFVRTRQNSVQMMGVICTNCGLETATITLSHKFDDFRKKNITLNHQQQISLFQSMFGDLKQDIGTPEQKLDFQQDFGTPAPKHTENVARFCENCGTARSPRINFCEQCGHQF